jgi:hypothetical protein
MAMATLMRVAGNKESKEDKKMMTATRVTGKQTVMATMRVMAMAMREAGKEEGDGKGSKSSGNGNKEGDGKENYDGKQ